MSSVITSEPILSVPQHNRIARTAANLTSVIGGEGLLRVANFMAAVAIARTGGAVLFGTYATILAYATIATMLADNGLQTAIVRDIARFPTSLNRIFSRAYASKALLFLPLVAALPLIVWGLHLSTQACWIAVLLTARTMLQSYCQLQIAALKALDRMKGIGFIQAAHTGCLLAGIWYAYHTAASIEFFIAVLIAGQSIEWALELILLFSYGARPTRVSWSDCAATLRASTPMGISFAIANAILRVDVIILSIIGGSAAAGIFAAAQTPIVMVYVVSWLFGSVLLSDFSRLHANGESSTTFIRHWTRIILLVTVPLTILGMTVGPKVVQALFGRSFENVGPLFVVMISATPFVLLSSLFINRAIAIHATRVYLGTYIVVGVFAVLCDLLLARSMGPLGVAFGMVGREAFMLCLIVLLLRNHPEPDQRLR